MSERGVIEVAAPLHAAAFAGSRAATRTGGTSCVTSDGTTTAKIHVAAACALLRAVTTAVTTAVMTAVTTAVTTAVATAVMTAAMSGL